MNRGLGIQVWPLLLTVLLVGCAEMKSTMEQLGVVEHREPIPMPSGPALKSEDIVFYHQAFSTKPYKLEDLLKEGTAVGNEKDEFGKQATFQREAPIVARRIEQVKERPAVYTTLSKGLGEYDF